MYRDCFERYWRRAQILTTIDVDEFIYPCPVLWNSSNVFEAAISKLNDNATHLRFDEPRRPDLPVVAELECYKYGMHGRLRNPPPDRSTVATYRHRASYEDDAIKYSLPNDTVAGCAQLWHHLGAHCQNYGARKHLYVTLGLQEKSKYAPVWRQRRLAPRHLDIVRREGVVRRPPPREPPRVVQESHPWLPIVPSVHWFRGPSALIRMHRAHVRTQPMCCNHYPQRSFADVKDKGIKNRNFNATKWNLIGTVDHPSWKYWDMVYDDSARVFYAQLMQQGYREL